MPTDIFLDIINIHSDMKSIRLITKNSDIILLSKNEKGKWVENNLSSELGLENICYELNLGLSSSNSMQKAQGLISQKMHGFFFPKIQLYNAQYNNAISFSIKEFQKAGRIDLLEKYYWKLKKESRASSLSSFNSLSEIKQRYEDLKIKYAHVLSNKEKCVPYAKIIEKIIQEMKAPSILGVEVSPIKKNTLKGNILLFLDWSKFEHFSDFSNSSPNEAKVVKALAKKKYASIEELISALKSI